MQIMRTNNIIQKNVMYRRTTGGKSTSRREYTKTDTQPRRSCISHICLLHPAWKASTAVFLLSWHVQSQNERLSVKPSSLSQPPNVCQIISARALPWADKSFSLSHMHTVNLGEAYVPFFHPLHSSYTHPIQTIWTSRTKKNL